jgi:hypothetical protein
MHFFDDNGTKPLKGPTILSKASSTPNEGIVEGPVVDGPVVDGPVVDRLEVDDPVVDVPVENVHNVLNVYNDKGPSINSLNVDGPLSTVQKNTFNSGRSSVDGPVVDGPVIKVFHLH